MQQEQDVVGMTFGVIAYLRCLFSEESFQDCKYNDLKLKTLKNTSETRKVMEWIENINRNKEKIHKIVLALHSLEEGNQKIVEMYSFNIVNELDFKTVCKSLQGMKALKGKFVVKLKIFTTAFLEIQGFKRTDSLWESCHLKEKEMEGFKIYSEDFEIKENPIEAHSSPIKCICGIDTNEKEMILCKKCKLWTHAACHGYFSSKDRRIGNDFNCFYCLGITTKEIRDCSIYRRVLSILYNEDFETIVDRSAKNYTKFVSSLKPNESFNKDFSEVRNSMIKFIQFRLGLTVTFAAKLIAKLVCDGFLNRKCEIVKTREIKEKIKSYFNGKRMECLIATDEIDCIIP